MRSNTLTLNNDALLDSLTLPTLPPGIVPERSRTSSTGTGTNARGSLMFPSYSGSYSSYTGNRLLDGDDPWYEPETMQDPVQTEESVWTDDAFEESSWVDDLSGGEVLTGDQGDAGDGALTGDDDTGDIGVADSGIADNDDGEFGFFNPLFE
jgi:hypothetical protein